jgi:hypothetical protein
MSENKAPWGKRMFKVSIHFWTNGLPKPESGRLAWDSGTVHIHSGRTQDATPAMVHFHGHEQLLSAIQGLLDEQELKLVAERRIVNQKGKAKVYVRLV